MCTYSKKEWLKSLTKMAAITTNPRGEDDEFVEGDEREDMAEERLVGETDDFF